MNVMAGCNDIAEGRIQILEQQIEYHNKKYWEEGEIEIPDEDYDMLVEELKILAPDSPVFTILEEQKSVENQNKHVHSDPMLSLEKFYSKAEVIEWMRKTGRGFEELFKFQLKLDGISGRQENNVLATRGDGRIGENHTDKIPYIEHVGFSGVEARVDGEIIITDKFFEDNLKGEFKNSRNAVAGLMGRKHPEEIKGKGVTFISFDFDEIGFEGNIDAIEAGWDDMIKALTSKGLPYDGIVVKIADADYYKQLGNKTKSPKGAIAYKFANKSAITKVKGITWQVSRNGKLTPVAELEPIELAGVTISRATCHNYNFVVVKGIYSGVDVKIERAGDVIPKVISTINSGEGKVGMGPPSCPCCGGDVRKSEKDVDIFCTNENCPDRIIENIVFMAKTIGIDELGRPTAEKLRKTLLWELYNISDMGLIRYEDLLSLEGYGEKSAKTLYNNIDQSLENINEIKFLASFGIEGIGRTMTDKLLTVAGDLPSLFQMDKEALMAICGVGEKLADNFINAVKERAIEKIYTDYCYEIVIPRQEHKNIAGAQQENIVYAIIDTPRGQYKFPAKLIAEQRADYYSCRVDGHEKGSEEWQGEVDFAMRDTSELVDWLWNNSDWEDWEKDAERINGDVKISEEDFWCAGNVEFVEGELAESCKPKTICFTGKMPETRKFYEGIASERGMKPASSVNKDLDILVISEAGWTSGKVKKAEKYGTEIIPLEDWI